jgi:hypothetical protein
MELFFNLAWALLAALMLCLWLSFSARKGACRRVQFVALSVVLLVLFPVISITDDLLAAQSPAAETESCVRKDHASTSPHSIFPAVAALPLSVFVVPCLGLRCIAVPGLHRAPVVENAALAPIENRPPPTA